MDLSCAEAVFLLSGCEGVLPSCGSDCELSSAVLSAAVSAALTVTEAYAFIEFESITPSGDITEPLIRSSCELPGVRARKVMLTIIESEALSGNPIRFTSPPPPLPKSELINSIAVSS